MRLLPFTGALCHEWERLKHPAPTLSLTGGKPTKTHFLLFSFTEKEKEKKKKKGKMKAPSLFCLLKVQTSLAKNIIDVK